ncbi:Protein N-acetyltransferase, RimJ/RimL family [Micromonospora nigra]|uniref:Protein N-acetyltransferase, RimJ/RimL family n=1 Tax=Micromonospora nigra TaxID=145857 RepID=A0A1C6SVQ6_9ACTN|nr:Protein N-acetyltransferase, RimJ/RimL family [Micromonospora nigra]
MELAAPGLLLRPWRAQDAPAVHAALREPDIARWNPQGDLVTVADAAAWIRRRADWSDGGHVSLAVTDADDGTLLGAVALHSIVDEDAGIGYWTVVAARGRGVATRAVRALSTWGFTARGLHRIELCHAVANRASCRVAERAGFPAEGTLRQSHRYGDGRRHDEHLHARLATDD